MRNSKSQAALEFIMTYGWAILVVLVSIGALAYFGVLSPDKFLPAKCVFPPGIGCVDHKVTINSLAITVRNSLGYDVTIDAVKAELCTALGAQGTLTNGASPITYTLVCNGIVAGSTKYNQKVNITYTNIDTSQQHTAQGQVTSRIE